MCSILTINCYLCSLIIRSCQAFCVILYSYMYDIHVPFVSRTKFPSESKSTSDGCAKYM